MDKLNPHNWLSALDPPGSANRRWRCQYCGMEDFFDNLRAVACTYVYPPCEHCGETPECAQDCPGIAAALSGSGVYLVGFIGAARGDA
jgi:Fe-S-cluster-containing dehydrogenase component